MRQSTRIWSRALRVRGSRHLGQFALATAFLFAHPAVGQKEPTTARHEADALFEQGKAALKRGNWPEACEKFGRSLELDPTPSTHIKVARCHEHDGGLKAAWDNYSQALELIRARASSDEHTRALHKLILAAKTAIEPRLATLRIQWSRNPGQASVSIDDRAIPTNVAADGVFVDPGSHRILVTASGFRVDPIQLTLAEGEKRSIVVELAPVPPSGRTPPPVTPAPRAAIGTIATQHPAVPAVAKPPGGNAAKPPPVTPAPRAAIGTIAAQHPAVPAVAKPPGGDAALRPNPGRAQSIVGYATGGTGIALLGVAAYLGYKTRSTIDQARENNHCDANFDCDSVGMGLVGDADRTQLEALVFAAGGTVLMATGIVLLVTAPTAETVPRSTTPKLGLRVSPWGASLGGNW